MTDVTLQDQKTLAEIQQLNADTRKLLAEAAKLKMDRMWIPVATVAALVGALATTLISGWLG